MLLLDEPFSALDAQTKMILQQDLARRLEINLDEMRTKPSFVRVTNAGMTESHVHDVTITREAPNYRID